MAYHRAFEIEGHLTGTSDSRAFNGLTFGGRIQMIDDGYYTNPDGTRGAPVPGIVYEDLRERVKAYINELPQE